MGRVDLSDITPDQEAKIKIIHRDAVEELKAARRSYPANGALDGGKKGRDSEVYARMRRRIREYIVDGIEPIPDKETGLGAWSEELEGVRE